MEKAIFYTVITSSGEVLIKTSSVSELVINLDQQGLSTYLIMQLLKEGTNQTGHVLVVD